MSNDVDDFLAHFGIPGMKWGRRNSSVSVATDRPQLTPEQKRERAKKIATLTAAGALGAYYVYKKIDRKRKINALSAKNFEEGKKAAQALITSDFGKNYLKIANGGGAGPSNLIRNVAPGYASGIEFLSKTAKASL